MTSLTTYLENQVQRWWADGDSFDSPPTNIYIALHDGPPGEDASNNEVSASDYSRKETALTVWSVDSGSGPTSVKNDSSIEFPEATNDWGEISYISFWDSLSGGNALWKGDLSSIEQVGSGDKVTFSSESIRVDLD